MRQRWVWCEQYSLFRGPNTLECTQTCMYRYQSVTALTIHGVVDINLEHQSSTPMFLHCPVTGQSGACSWYQDDGQTPDTSDTMDNVTDCASCQMLCAVAANCIYWSYNSTEKLHYSVMDGCDASEWWRWADAGVGAG